MKVNFKSTSDGWRGKLAQSFTFDNVSLVAHAVSTFIINDLKDNKLLVCYDTRFMSSEFAKHFANIAMEHKIAVTMFPQPLPTPILAFATKNFLFPCGITITASHNPPFDNGIKIRMGYGGTPSKKDIKKIESYFTLKSSTKLHSETLNTLDPLLEYIKTIRQYIDLTQMKQKDCSVLIDTMHGTTVGILKKILAPTNVSISYLNANVDPYFGGIPPEPKYETTKELQKKVESGEYDFGLAHDGDGDRIIAVLKKVGYLSPHDIAAILLLYLVKYKKLHGDVIGSSTLGRRVRKIAESFNLVFEEVPVGFKNATEIMLSRNILLAAEENGGLGFGFHLPERDGILSAALLIEAHYTVKGGITSLLKEVESIAGKSGFSRFNYVSHRDRKEIMKKILSLPSNYFAFQKIVKTDTNDGIKIFYKTEEWVSIRFSGTEDIIRIYTESDTREKAEEIVQYICSRIKKLEGKL